jgi:hypothetical protein
MGDQGDERDDHRVPDFIRYLPERIWYLTQSGRDMWCRRPYGFFFTSSAAAARFAVAMETSFELTPIGIESRQLVSSDAVEAMRQQEITRVFLDPQVDPTTGDVYGTILRFPELN